MARESSGDKKLKLIVDSIKQQVEYYESDIRYGNSMVNALRKQLKFIETTCHGVGYDNKETEVVK